MLLKSAVSLVFLLPLVLGGCNQRASDDNQMMLSPAKTPFRNTDIAGLDYAKDFALTDHNGVTRKLADFRGKAVFIFFGYTHCPDVCPTTMAEMAAVMKELGLLAEKVQVLFVTLDPQRDTPALLAQYVPAFDPHFLGLTGDKAAIDKVTQDFKVFYQKVPGKTADTYTIDHTSAAYIFDPKGRVRLFVRNGKGSASVVHDVKLLLSES